MDNENQDIFGTFRFFVFMKGGAGSNVGKF